MQTRHVVRAANQKDFKVAKIVSPRNHMMLVTYVDSKETPPMSTQLSQFKWGRMTINTIRVYLFSFLTMMAIILVYAFYLGFQARGMPAPHQIAQFANQYAPLLGSYGLIPFTFLVALRMSRRDEVSTPFHGIMLGVIVGLLNLVISPLGLDILIIDFLAIGAGWLGGKLGYQK